MEKSLIRRLLSAAWLFSTVAIIAAQDQLPRPTTDQQKAHAAYHESRNPGLTSSVLESGGSSVWADAGAPSRDSAISLDVFLLDRTCSADLVVVGTVLAKHPMLTVSDRMIFTDYHVEIRAVLRSAQPMTRRTVGLTRPGGSIATGGRQLGIKLSDTPELETTGEYVLFLRALETGFYAPMEKLHTIRPVNGTVRIFPLGRWSPFEFFDRQFTPEELKTRVARASSQCPLG